MCGISGIISSDILEPSVATKNILDMNNLISHRGPDDSGLHIGKHFAFGHTRLSIIDTSNGGHQPMIYQSRYVITFNGEIYNYVELKKELESLGYKFNNSSDTEVILAGYSHWKEEVVHKLNGMFAFAIYDLITEECFMARDRSGVKPLYYYEKNNLIYFFSEPKQIVLSDIIKAVPNHNAINEYLAFQFTLDEKTFFSGINKLLPGHSLRYKDGALKIEQYWAIDGVKADKEISYSTAKENISKLIDDAVDIRLRADVEVGSYLSGGIDSSVIASIASKHKGRIRTYTFTSKDAPKYDESELARVTAERIGSEHNEIELNYKDILDVWRKSIYFMDEPEVGYSLIPQLEISKVVARDIKVILGGQGGDELFYGYGWHSQLFGGLFSTLSDVSFSHKLKVFFALAKSVSFKGKLKILVDTIKNICRTVEAQYFENWASHGAFELLIDKSIKSNFYKKLNFDGSLLSIKKFEYKYWLHALLHVEDRSSMSASLESRVPLLDYRIAEYVFQLPPEYMINGALNKKILIDSQNEHLDRKISQNTHKKGYASPIESWFQEESVKSYIGAVINNRSSFIYQFVKFKPLEQLTARQVWMLISVEIWHKTFITKELNVFQ